jgi:LysR substrate binding domain
LRARLLAGDLEVSIYALPGEEADERIHSIPLFREQMVLAVYCDHRLANTGAFPVREMNGEYYIHRMNCEFAGYADQILQQRGVTCKPVYWSERDDWTLAMVAAGLGFAFMPANAVKHPGVIGLPVVEPEFWREVKLVSVRGRRYSPGVGSLVREAMRKTWYGKEPKRVMDSEGGAAQGRLPLRGHRRGQSSARQRRGLSRRGQGRPRSVLDAGTRGRKHQGSRHPRPARLDLRANHARSTDAGSEVKGAAGA